MKRRAVPAVAFEIDKRRYSVALLMLVLVSTCGALARPARGQQGPTDLSGELAAKIDAVVERERVRLKIPGLNIAIARNGRLLYEKGFGMADLEQQVPATPDTRFRTASIAKPITATAVMQLVERGALDLDAPIQKYCPAFPQKPWPVTARQLLGHLAGVRHYTRPGESAGTEHFFALVDSLKLFKDDPLLHEPGTKYEYSTYGYSVLGCAIEGASTMTYPDYVRGHVFEPASMSHTDIDHVFLIRRGRARGYQLLDEEGYARLPPAAKTIAKPGEIYNAVLHDTSMKIPGGGLLSTASDLVRFALAVRDGKLVKPESVAAMWSMQKTRDGKDTGYGLGWGLRMTDGKLTGVSHGGNQAGAASALRLAPADGDAIAVMTNLEDAPLGTLLNNLATVIRGPSQATSSATPMSGSFGGMYRAEFLLDGHPYTGTMQLAVSRGTVSGRISLEVPVGIDGQVAGRLSDGTLRLEYEYVMRADGCRGQTKIDASVAVDGTISGTALVSGACVARPMNGTVRMVK